jgi:hypothetical protein
MTCRNVVLVRLDNSMAAGNPDNERWDQAELTESREPDLLADDG